MASEDKIDALWGALKKDLADDPNANLFALSTVPHGIPTGQPYLDLCIGRDGLPVGRVIEFFGFERSGKTTAALHAAARVQKRGGIVLFIDTETTFEEDRAVECGCIPGSFGSTFQIASAQSVDSIIRTILLFLDRLEEIGWKQDVLIIVDSITAVECEFNLDKTFGTIPRAAEDARTLKAGMKRIVPRLASLKVPCIFINHAIENPAAMFGKKSKAAGGHAIKFAASVRVEFTHLGELKDKKTGVREGQRIKVTVEKVKGAHLKRTTFDTQLLNAEGFDFTSQLLEASIEIGLIKKVGQGRGTQYCLLDAETKETIESLTKEEWQTWVASRGKEECYNWFLQNAKALREIIPWAESRLDG